MTRALGTIAVLGACVALAACSGPTPKPDDPETSTPSATKTTGSLRDPKIYFQTSDKNITCGVRPNEDGELATEGKTPGVGCFINKTNYDVLSSCVNKDGADAYGIVVERSGQATDFPCNGGPQAIYGFTAGDKVTPATVKFGTVDLDAAWCVVSKDAVSCLNRDGHGFYLGKQSRALL